MKKNTTENFIEKARKVHGDKYDYSKTEYINAKTKVCIICPEHGEFWQKPVTHLNGVGCPICGRIKANEKISSNKEKFIEKAREVHGDKYNYSKVVYINKKTPVCIICPEHGEFWQTPNSHIYNKNGCRLCSKEKLSNERKMSNEDWIKKAREIHGNKYDYTKTKYDGYYKKVTITCPIHGDFEQLSYDHLQGKGCPKCRSSHLEIEIENFLEEQKIKYIRQYRPKFLQIGKSHLSVDFYLPDYNIAIECQGKQHFIGNTFYSQNINRIIERDKIKKEYLEQHNILVLYFTNEKGIDYYFGELFVDKKELLNRIKENEKLL